MKKWIWTAALTLFASGTAFALPLGNPAEASFLQDGLFWDGYCLDYCDPCSSWCDAWSIRVGFYGDYVFNRHLELDDNAPREGIIEHASLYTNAGYIALNFWDRFDIFTALGATNFFISTNANTLGNPQAVLLNGRRLDIETNTDFSWTLGGRITLLECGCTTFGIVGQYFSTCTEVKRVTLADTLSFYPDETVNFEYGEWQIGIGVAHRIWKFVPYLGAKYSHVTKADFDDASFAFAIITTPDVVTLFDLENRFNGGLVLGVSLVDCEKIALTVEYRWPDEKAVYTNMQIRF